MVVGSGLNEVAEGLLRRLLFFGGRLLGSGFGRARRLIGRRCEFLRRSGGNREEQQRASAAQEYSSQVVRRRHVRIIPLFAASLGPS
jgi:hypothetical protein